MSYNSSFLEHNDSVKPEPDSYGLTPPFHQQAYVVRQSTMSSSLNHSPSIIMGDPTTEHLSSPLIGESTIKYSFKREQYIPHLARYILTIL